VKLKNRIAVIAGGSSGIGLATTAQEFKVQGSGGNYLERNVEAVAKAAKEIGGDTVGVTADVSRVADLDRAFQTIREKAGHVDVLL
jgi:NADP-dependent 3-hydroxy acid dehydrogenase YdfG